MKLLIYSLLLAVVACSTQPKIPCICQRNYNECLGAYNPATSDNTKESWGYLCKQDLKTCKSGRGM